VQTYNPSDIFLKPRLNANDVRIILKIPPNNDDKKKPEKYKNSPKVFPLKKQIPLIPLKNKYTHK
jgi:hypothetical protein